MNLKFLLRGISLEYFPSAERIIPLVIINDQEGFAADRIYFSAKINKLETSWKVAGWRFYTWRKL